MLLFFSGFFVNFSILPLICCYATPMGHSLPICASNGDTGGVYIPFWTSSLFGDCVGVSYLVVIRSVVHFNIEPLV